MMEKFSNSMVPQGGSPEQGLAAKLSQIDALVKEVMAMTATPAEEKPAEEDMDLDKIASEEMSKRY